MKNYYIDRNEALVITGLYARLQYEGQEKLSENSQEMIDYFATEEAEKDAEKIRADEIEAEKESAGLKKITVQQAHDKIDQLFSGATTVALLRAACIRTFKILVVFILK